MFSWSLRAELLGKESLPCRKHICCQWRLLHHPDLIMPACKPAASTTELRTSAAERCMVQIGDKLFNITRPRAISYGCTAKALTVTNYEYAMADTSRWLWTTVTSLGSEKHPSWGLMGYQRTCCCQSCKCSTSRQLERTGSESYAPSRAEHGKNQRVCPGRREVTCMHNGASRASR